MRKESKAKKNKIDYVFHLRENSSLEPDHLKMDKMYTRGYLDGQASLLEYVSKILAVRPMTTTIVLEKGQVIADLKMDKEEVI